MSEAPSEPLRLFLRDHVLTFEELQALLCVAREPARAWSAEEVAASTRVELDQVEAALSDLAQRGGLVEAAVKGRSPLYSYAPASPAKRALVSELARAYDEQLLSIVRVMSDNALARVRSTAARRLAEAFRLDREKK